MKNETLLWALPAFCIVQLPGCARITIDGSVAGSFEDHRASRTDDSELNIKTGETLNIDSRVGSVSIQTLGGGGAKPSVKAKITASGESYENAAVNLEKCKLQMTRGGKGVTLQLIGEDYEYRTRFTVVRMRPRVDLEIVVPDGVALDIRCGSGNVRAAGPFASCEVESKFGNIEIERVDGELTAHSNSGSIKLTKIGGAKTIDAKSGYGSVTIRDAAAELLKAESSSGIVEIVDSKAKEIQSSSSYGKLVFERVSGRVAGKTSSGSVHLTDAAAESFKLESGYGSITVEKVSGDLTASTASGSVNISDFKGSVDAQTQYGSVDVEGTLGGLKVASKSGKVNVRALSGSAMADDWTATSGYGSINITLPADTYCELDARTNYGSISCDFSVLVPGGSSDSNKSNRKLSGLMNSEASASKNAAPRKLILSTSSGSIEINK